jgi:hypothetical protein
LFWARPNLETADGSGTKITKITKITKHFVVFVIFVAFVAAAVGSSQRSALIGRWELGS